MFPELGCACCRHRRTIDFAYDADKDTPEEIADEITNEFELSSTDRDICAAALKVSRGLVAPHALCHSASC